MRQVESERHDEQYPHGIDAPRLLRDDTQFASGKIAAFQYVTVAVFVFLLASFWDLQVRNEERYSEAALRNSVKSLPVLAPRGRILDRDGRAIVENHAEYSLILDRQVLKREHLPAIAAGVGLDLNELIARVDRFALRPKRPKNDKVIVKQELTRADLAFVNSHNDPYTFPEMGLLPAYRRVYPKDGVAAHVIGYVGEVSERELDLPDFVKYTAGEIIGKTGLERQYNDTLIGKDGQRQWLVDNMGVEHEEIGFKEAIPGTDLQLTLDLDLQAVAEIAMAGKRGAVVALDPRTGEVLAMVSTPAYDPSRFAGRISTAEWTALTEDPAKPLLNRAIQAQQAPGSTFKPIMAIAGLESGEIDDSFSVFCPGGATFYGHYHACHNKAGHGAIELHRAIAQSCDVFFYNVGNRLGIDRIADYAEQFGIGHKTGIDLPNEAAGLMPSSKWKMRTARQKWYAGETISVAIGQGAVVVTPLQLVSAVGALAAGGEWHRPHLVLGAKTETRTIRLNAANVAKVVSGMCDVVNGNGTAPTARITGIEVCGKTGTAQLVSNDYARAKGSLGEAFKDNAWFVAFAPRVNPEIAVVALWENGVHSYFAAPIVRDVIKSYFDKRVRRHQFEIAKTGTPRFGVEAPAEPGAEKPAPQPEILE